MLKVPRIVSKRGVASEVGGVGQGGRAGAVGRVLLLIAPMWGCFATLQTAEVKEGFHIAVGGGVLSDQERRGRAQGPDYIVVVAPSFSIGMGRDARLGINVPLVAYYEEGKFRPLGSESAQLLLQPQLKLGLNQRKRDKFAILAEFMPILYPGSLSVIYSHDFDGVTAYVVVKHIFTYGPAGDDPVITRYQQEDQAVWVFSAGTEFPVTPHPLLEAGMMINSFSEPHDGGATRAIDFFVAARVGI